MAHIADDFLDDRSAYLHTGSFVDQDRDFIDVFIYDFMSLLSIFYQRIYNQKSRVWLFWRFQ